MMDGLADGPHRRYNALTGEWVLVSPHRTRRPWQGQQEKPAVEQRPSYDPACYLCPGNERAGGMTNPDYTEPFVFTNDFAALMPDQTVNGKYQEGLLKAEPSSGTCRVICFSPRHDLTLPEMAPADIRKVIDVWARETADLGRRYKWVQVFENKGAVMGCSNPHPHGQVWAGNFLPNEPAKEDACQRAHHHLHQSPLLMDYAAMELREQERIVEVNEHWIAVVPFWAVWPFETLLMPRRHIHRMPDLRDAERNALSQILKSLLTRYDNLFSCSFPYSMGWHGAPTGVTREADTGHWQLHAHFYPPLLRSASVKKFMVGYEMLAEAQRDLTPEQAASRLREQSSIHFKKQKESVS